MKPSIQKNVGLIKAAVLSPPANQTEAGSLFPRVAPPPSLRRLRVPAVDKTLLMLILRTRRGSIDAACDSCPPPRWIVGNLGSLMPSERLSALLFSLKLIPPPRAGPLNLFAWFFQRPLRGRLSYPPPPMLLRRRFDATSISC